MVKIKHNKIKNWLELTGHNANWLADKLNISNGYVSQMLNNSEVSGEMISSLLMLTHFKFEKLFDVIPNGKSPTKANYEKFNKRED